METPPADSFSERQPGSANGPVPAAAPPGPAEDTMPDVEPGASVDEDTPEVSPRRRRWALWLGVPAAGLLLAVGLLIAYRLLAPPQYEAVTRLHVYPEQPYNLFPNPRGRTDFDGYKRTQAAMIKSRMVLSAALRKHVDPKNPASPTIGQLRLLKDQPDPVSWLEEHLVADYASEPEILTISLSGGDPEELVPIVNTITHVYLEDVVDKERLDRLQWLDKLNGIYKTYRDRLENKRRDLRVLADAAGANDPANISLMQRLALEQAARIQKELLELQSEVRRLKVQEARLAHAPGPGPGL
jgi:uncharacterized protein involved in exopolysaccharide biosynthesis